MTNDTESLPKAELEGILVIKMFKMIQISRSVGTVD